MAITCMAAEHLGAANAHREEADWSPPPPPSAGVSETPPTPPLRPCCGVLAGCRERLLQRPEPCLRLRAQGQRAAGVLRPQPPLIKPRWPTPLVNPSGQPLCPVAAATAAPRAHALPRAQPRPVGGGGARAGGVLPVGATGGAGPRRAGGVQRPYSCNAPCG